MKLSLFIAVRYVFSKKKKTFINFLSYFSIASISIGTAAMIIVLSVFNGLENTLMSVYKGFDPSIKIEHKKNKYFFVMAIILFRGLFWRMFVAWF